MRRPYKLILFDFFNTLALADPSSTPTLEINGRRVVSTAGVLAEFLRERHPDVQTRHVYHAMDEATRLAREKRGPKLKEISALERFRHLEATLPLAARTEGLAEEMLARHMGALVGSFRLPPAHREFLQTLAGDFRLAIFSNFDHAPALQGFLEALGIDAWFEPVVISDAIGYRKPGPQAFARAIEMTGVPAACILFVGDSLTQDVAGANAAGLDVAWFNPGGEPEGGGASPTFVVESLPALAPILQSNSA